MSFGPPLVYLPVQPLPEKSLSHVQREKMIRRASFGEVERGAGGITVIKAEGRGVGYRMVNQSLCETPDTVQGIYMSEIADSSSV